MLDATDTPVRVLANAAETLTHVWYVDGTATDPDGATTTVAVTRVVDGTTVVAPGTATTRTAIGTFTYELGPRPSLDLLKVSWSATFGGLPHRSDSYVEVVGGFHASLARIRAMPNLGDTTKFTNDELARARDWWERLAEEFCGRAFVPRFGFHRHRGTGDLVMSVPGRPVRAVRAVAEVVAGVRTAWDASAVAAIVVEPEGTLLAWSGWLADRVYEVEYEFGMDTPPGDIAEAALVAIRDKLLTDETGRPAISVVNEFGGTTRFSLPRPGSPTGIPIVDETLRRWRVAGVA